MLDYSRLKYKLDQVKLPELLKVYPELEEIYYEAVSIHGTDVKHEPLRKTEVMAFIVLSYDINSPLAKEASIHKRRHQALGIIGYNLTSDKDFQEQKGAAKLISGDNLFINRLALHYCKLQNSFDWSELCTLQDSLDDVDYTLKSESVGAGNKSANEMLNIKLTIREKSKKTRDEMRAIASSLFRDDIHLLDYTASQMVLEKRKSLITPENIVARQREQG